MIIGRLAPSPTGRMHLGNAFSSLLAWLSVRSQGGRLLLRIEDLDPVRSRENYTSLLMKDLEWLGLDWDGAPDPGAGPGYDSGIRIWRQSQRTDFYKTIHQQLAAHHTVYPCFCTRAQLHAASAPHQSDGYHIYSGRCRALSPQQLLVMCEHRSPALRVEVPDVTVSFLDGLQGPYRENLAHQCGDFILRRSDGIFAYQLAAPADDGAMGITEVVRGRDLLSSTPRQIWLLQTLGYTVPRYYHVPLLLAPDGRRLAKRDRDLDFDNLRKKYRSPHALVGWLAHLAGLLDQPEPVSAAELIRIFDWRNIHIENIVIRG